MGSDPPMPGHLTRRSDTRFGGADGSLNALATLASASGAPSTAETVLATDSTAASVAVRDSAVDAGVVAALYDHR